MSLAARYTAGLPGALPPLPGPFRWLPIPWPASLWADCLFWLSAGAALYGRLKEYLLTEDQLKENGYPFLHPERPGGAIIFTAEDKPPKDRELPLPPVLHGGHEGKASW